MRYLFLLLALIASVAYAASVNLTWTAPTANTDGTPLAGAVSYGVYHGGVKLTTTALNTITIYAGLIPGTTQCFQVTAIVDAAESIPSNSVCVAVPAGTTRQIPKPPTGLRIR